MQWRCACLSGSAERTHELAGTWLERGAISGATFKHSENFNQEVMRTSCDSEAEVSKMAVLCFIVFVVKMGIPMVGIY